MGFVTAKHRVCETELPVPICIEPRAHRPGLIDGEVLVAHGHTGVNEHPFFVNLLFQIGDNLDAVGIARRARYRPPVCPRKGLETARQSIAPGLAAVIR